GRQLDARRAQKLGLVDEICHPTDLRTAAEKLARSSGAARLGIEKRRGQGQGFAARAAGWLAKIPFAADALVYGKARAGVIAKTGGHYPAPLVAIDIVREGMKLPLERGFDLEAGAFSELVVSETAKNLIGIFFKKNEVEARAGRIAKGAPEVERVGVLGAGLMGAGIAQGLAARGAQVVMKDRDYAALGRGVKASQQRFREQVQRKRLREPEAKLGLARIHPTLRY